MRARSSFIFGTGPAVLAAALALFGCSSAASDANRSGSIDVLVQSNLDTRRAGSLTVRSEDGVERWSLPLRSATWQTRRLTLPPGRYTLVHEPDVTLEPGAESSPLTATARFGALPRWVEVSPGRATSVRVQLESEASATRVAVRQSMPGVPLN